MAEVYEGVAFFRSFGFSRKSCDLGIAHILESSYLCSCIILIRFEYGTA